MWDLKIVGLFVFLIAIISPSEAQNFRQTGNVYYPQQRQSQNAFNQRPQPQQFQPNGQRVSQGRPGAPYQQQQQMLLQQFNQAPSFSQGRPQQQVRPGSRPSYQQQQQQFNQGRPVAPQGRPQQQVQATRRPNQKPGNNEMPPLTSIFDPPPRDCADGEVWDSRAQICRVRLD